MRKQSSLVRFDYLFYAIKMGSDITKMEFIGLGRETIYFMFQSLMDPRRSRLSIGSLFQGEL